MGSPEVLDFDRLLSPLPGASPCGAFLREDFSPTSRYYAVKDARSAARAAERSQLWADDEAAGGERPNWRPVVELGVEILAEQSKDLEVAAWLTEALVRKHGYAGLRDGFRLLRELVERFWDDLHPQPDEDGIQTRLAPLIGLNGEESDGVLISPIANVPITTAGSYRTMAISDYRQALDLERIDDAQKRQQRIDQGAVSLAMFERSISETPDEHLRDVTEDLGQAIVEFQALTEVLDEKCGLDDRGYPLAPPSSSIRGALNDCFEQLAGLTRHRFAVEVGGASAGEEDAGPAASSRGVSKRVETREQAFESLLQIAEFFKRTEPHSPISYALEQAVRWGKLPLPELLKEWVPDSSSREQIFKLIGIQESENRD